MTPTDERLARVGELEICWQAFGAEDDPPLLMIMGLGAQMIQWPDGLCALLAARGLRVIRFDNRDAGRSTVLSGADSPAIAAALRGETDGAAYTLSDMAGDAAGLLDALGIDRAHVVGASLGGMIAQTLALEHRDRVRSLASIQSTTGDPGVGGPSPVGLKSLTSTPPSDREGYIKAVVTARRLIGSRGFPIDGEHAGDLAERSFERGYHPDGTQRQVIAIIASGDRTPRLRGLDLPTVVIHGEDDELINVSGGRATAAAIPGARLIVIPGMGHDLPPETWDTIADAVVANAKRG